MMVEGWTYVGLGTALLAVVLTVVARKYNEWTCAVRVKAGEPPLPAGSMGWPLLGESLHFMTCEYYEMYKQKFSKYVVVLASSSHLIFLAFSLSSDIRVICCGFANMELMRITMRALSLSRVSYRMT